MQDKVHDTDGNNFKVYVGTVAEDKPMNSREIKVICPELSPTINGPVADTTQREKVDLQDHTGKAYTITVKTTNGITATWQGETNRTYPPDVKKGERVIIQQYANNDTYYWYSAGRNDDNRTRERLRYHVKNSSSVVDGLTDNNTYFFEMDTVNKCARLHLSKNDGEPFAYDLLFDTKNGIFKLNDDIGNEIYLNSAEKGIKLTNAAGTFLYLNNLDGIFAVKQDMVLMAGKQILYKTPVMTFANDGGDGVTEFNAKSIAFNMSDSFNIKASCIGLDGDVKSTGTIVANAIRAAGYSTGDVGAPYSPASTDVAARSGSNPANTPDTSSDSSNRHCTAHEETLEAIQIIVDAIHMLEQQHGIDTGVSAAIPKIQEAIMNLNRGK